jgi:hypothetical protein
MFLKLPREEKPALDNISGLVFSQAPSRDTRGVHLKAIHEGCHLFIGIADMNEGQRSRVPGIWWPRTVWINGRNFLIPVLRKASRCSGVRAPMAGESLIQMMQWM